MDGPKSSAKNLYMVITFSSDGCEYVSAAPKLWLIKEENNDTIFCMWPKNKNIERKAIKLAMKPEADWIKYSDVHVVGYYATLKEALAVEKEKQNSSSSESELIRNKSKRKIISNKKYRDDSVSPPPQFDMGFDVIAPASEACSDKDLTGSNVIVELIEPVTGCSNDILESNTTSTNNTFVTKADIIQADVIIQDENLIKEVEKIPLVEVQSVISVGSSTASTGHSSCSCRSAEMMSELHQIKSFVTFTMRKVEAIELSIMKMNLSPEPESSNLPNFPLMELSQIKTLEEKLADESIRKELFNMLRYTGGSKERDCVNRCLEKIFSDYLAQYCSWTGKKNNFKLSSLTLMTVIKRAVMHTFPSITDESFERHIMSWFQHATTRLKRQN